VVPRRVRSASSTDARRTVKGGHRSVPLVHGGFLVNTCLHPDTVPSSWMMSEREAQTLRDERPPF